MQCVHFRSIIKKIVFETFIRFVWNENAKIFTLSFARSLWLINNLNIGTTSSKSISSAGKYCINMSRANSKTYLVLCVQLEHNLERFLSLPGLSTVLFHAVPTFAKRLVYFFIIYFLFGDFFFSLFGYSPVLVGLCMLVCVSVCVYRHSSAVWDFLSVPQFHCWDHKKARKLRDTL